MAKLMIRFLLLSSFWLGVVMAKAVPADPCMAIINHRITTATYNTQVDFAGHHFSGLLVFKALNDTTHRVVFITETGFKFFDFEFTPSGFSVKYCVSGLNRKIVIETLKRDLGYLSAFGEMPTPIITRTDSALIYKFANGKRAFDYYTTNATCTQLQRIEHGRDKRKSLIIDLEGRRSGNFEKVNVKDKPAHLRIAMKQVEN